MYFIVTLLALLTILVFPAAAQDDDPMEAQRCIWRCLAEYKGAAYQACVSKFCDGSGGEAEEAKPTPGVWSYGTHPKLGLGAFVTVGEEAFAVVCETPPDTGYIGALRMTPGLVPDPETASTLYTGPYSPSGSTMFKKTPAGFYEELGDICDVDVERLRKSKELWFPREKFLGFEVVGNQTVVRWERDGKPIELITEADLTKIENPIVVPLKGSTAAINRLLKACPKMRAAAAEGCSTGD